MAERPLVSGWRVGLLGLGITGLAATIVAPPRPRLLWNASASAPVGLYRVAPAVRLERGDLVVARVPQGARRLAAERRYLPANVPLVKRIAALPGDRVCATGAQLTVNGRTVAERLATDRRGRAMPWWRGCGALGEGQQLLLIDAPGSFDGRYFGPTRIGDVIGEARRLWPR